MTTCRTLFMSMVIAALLIFASIEEINAVGEICDPTVLPRNEHRVLVFDHSSPTSDQELSRAITEGFSYSIRSMIDVDVVTASRPAELTPEWIDKMAIEQEAIVAVWGEFYPSDEVIYIHSHLRIVPQRIYSESALELSLRTRWGIVRADLPTYHINFAPISAQLPESTASQQEPAYVRTVVLFIQGILRYFAGDFKSSSETYTEYLNHYGEQQDSMNRAFAYTLLGNAQLRAQRGMTFIPEEVLSATYLRSMHLLPNNASPINHLAIVRLMNYRQESRDLPDLQVLEKQLIHVIKSESNINSVRNLGVLYKIALESGSLKDGGITDSDYKDAIWKRLRLLDRIESSEHWPQVAAVDPKLHPGLHPGKKLAFIVGIEDYLDDEINDLEYAVDDARNFRELLADPKRGGFEDIIMLTSDPGDEKQPTRDNIYIALNELIRRVEDQDTVVIFFSGHGYEWGNKYYLITVDTELKTLESRAIEVREFVDKAREIAGRARNVIIFLDSCHAGGVLQSEKGIFGKGLDYGYYKPFADAQGEVTTIASCQVAQLAYEGDGNGIFTRCLLDALDGAADDDGNGFVDLVELYKYIENEVPIRADRLYPGKKQNPIGYANLGHVNIHIARCKEPGYLTVNVGPQFDVADILIDGKIIHGPVVDYSLNPGIYKLAVHVRGYKEKESIKPFNIVPNERHTVNVEMEPRSRLIAGLKSGTFPGWGDFPDNPGRGTTMLIIQGIVLVGTLATQVDYTIKLDDYEDARADYDEMIRAARSHSSEHSYQERLDRLELMDSSHGKAVDAKRRRNIFLFTSLGLRAIWGLESALLMPRAEIELPTTVLNTEKGLLMLSWGSRF